MQLGLKDKSSEHAAEGTAMHEVGEIALVTGGAVLDLVGQTFNGFVLSKDDAKTLFKGYIAPVRALAEGGHLLVEQRLSISHITDEKGAHGTSDTVILQPKKIIIADLKWGMGVQVDAEENDQLCMYALAALKQFDYFSDFETVHMIIFQPRLNHISEWEISVEQLLAIGERLKASAVQATKMIQLVKKSGIDALPDDAFKPSMDNCRWCKAKTSCKALREFVLGTVANEFVDLDTEEFCNDVITSAKPKVKTFGLDMLAKLMPLLELIQDWCKAVRAKGEAEIHAGNHIPGYKLVKGKSGNRSWISEEDAGLMLSMSGLDENDLYTKKLISPTAAEKLVEDVSPKLWESMKAYVTQTQGSPTVVPDSDKRPAIVVSKVEDEFDNETETDLV